MKNILCLLLIAGCQLQPPDQSHKARQELLKVEEEMSRLAGQAGFHTALLAFAHDSLIKPEEGRIPIIGRSALEQEWTGEPGTTSISWEPFKADASASGDLGYTIGTWKFERQDTTFYGTYYTIWKKNDQGIWKWVLDAGNNTPAPVR